MAEQTTDEKFMRMALAEAQKAFDRDEVPVGAIVVCDGQIVGRGHNLVETLQDATAHAEMQAITAASSTIGGKYLNQCTLYVTIEPCQMCAAAMMWCQLGRLVYGSDDPKRGFSTFDATFLHPKTSILKGVLESECAALTYNFFKKLR